MFFYIVNLTGVTKSYLNGAVTVTGSGTTLVDQATYVMLLAFDGTLRADILNNLVQISDGSTNKFSATDAIDYMRAVASNVSNTPYGAAVDGVGRLRVSDTDLLESLHFSNSGHSLLIATSLTGSATAASNTSTSSFRLTCTTSSSDTAIVQTRRYFRYNPGRSYLIKISGNMGAIKANTTQRWGYFDANNGLFFVQNGTTLGVAIRTNASGSPVDTITTQANWNLDKLDGTGPSGITLNTALHNLYVIDFLWHGAGRVRYGIFYNGKIVYCHQTNGGNVNASPYMRTPTLPLRVELNNTGTTASTTTLDLVCFSYQKESQDSISSPYLFSCSTKNVTANLGSTIIPLLSIRPKLTFNGLTNRIPIIPNEVSVATSAQIAYIQILLNTTLTGGSFASVDTNSAVEFDTAATAISGGTIVKELYVPASSSIASTIAANISAALELLSLGLNIAGNTQDVLTIAGRSTAGGTNTLAQIDWQEYQ